MKEKKQVRFFTICEHEQEQAYLRQMHQAGWKFVQVSGLCVYHFEQCAPEDVIYQLDYNQDGLAHKEEYVKMFSDCGWEYLQDYMGYSYFRKPASQTSGAEEIFCDDSSRLQMMERVLKGRLLPLLALFLCILVPGLAVSLLGHRYLLAGCYGVIMVLYLVIFGVFAYKYFQFKNKQ